MYLFDRYILITDNDFMIKSFADSEAEKIWNGKKSKKIAC